MTKTIENGLVAYEVSWKNSPRGRYTSNGYRFGPPGFDMRTSLQDHLSRYGRGVVIAVREMSAEETEEMLAR